MTFQTKLKFLAPILLGFALSQTSFAAPINSCGSIPEVGGYPALSCTLYYNGTPDTFNLSTLMTQTGPGITNSSLDANEVGSGYEIVINGNPSTLADNSTGLFNQSLWEAVLYFPIDPSDSPFSDTLDVYFPGSLPSASTVQAYNESLYGAGTDALFFAQATGSQTVLYPGTNDVFTVNTAPLVVAAPEPASLTLMGTGMLGACGIALFRRRKVANALPF